MPDNAPREIASRHTAEPLSNNPEALLASLSSPPLYPTAIQFSSDSRQLYVHDRKHLHVWTIPKFDDHACWPLQESESGSCYFFDNSEEVMLIASDDDSEEGVHHFAIRELSTLALKTAVDIRLERYGLMTIMLNRAEDQLFLRDAGNRGYFFELPSLEQIRTIDVLNTNHLIYSPQDSEIWATALSDTEGSDSNWLIAIDAQTGAVLRRRPPDKGTYLSGLWLSPDHSKLIVAGEDTLSVLDAQSWDLLHVLEIPVSPSAMRQGGMSQTVLTFAPDSRHLGIGHDGLEGFVIVDCKTWEVAFERELPERWYVRVCAFAPNGRYMACASYENHNEVKLFDFSDRLETS